MKIGTFEIHNMARRNNALWFWWDIKLFGWWYVIRWHKTLGKSVYRSRDGTPPRKSPSVESPIPLTDYQKRLCKQWAADDRLWTTQETVEFNLQTFARAILVNK